MPSKAKRSKKAADDRSWSTTKTCVALAFAWAAIVWGIAANAYHIYAARSEDAAHPFVGRSTALPRLIGLFIARSVEELPSAMDVISHAFAEKKWIPCILFLGEIGVLAFWFVLTHLERRMEHEERRRNRF
jgi:hypothetical protein